MKLASLSKILLISIFPLLLFLLVLNFASFDESFYNEKFSEYGISSNVEGASQLHKNVIDFMKGSTDSLPNEFNQREKEHLADVKQVFSAANIVLYALIALFALLLLLSVMTLKINNYITSFIGKVMVFGGMLTLLLALIVLFLINSNFSFTFDSFHRLLFEKGTYLFDPANEVIVNLYPEQIFMDLGIRISKGVFITAVVAIIIGIFLIFRSKKKK